MLLLLLQETEVAPVIAGYWEKAEFPHELVPKIAKLGLGGGTIKGNGCPGQSVVEAGLTCIEMARVDGSMSTFLMVHSSLCMLTIDLLGSEEQKQQLLPDLAALKTVGAWGLTEPSNGSDASALQTTAKKVTQRVLSYYIFSRVCRRAVFKYTAHVQFVEQQHWYVCGFSSVMKRRC